MHHNPSHALSKFRIISVLLLATLWVGFAQAQDDILTARVDRQEIAIDETVTLQVRYSGQVQDSQPDFSLLEEHFQILRRQRSNQFSAINGVITAFTEWTLMLAPKKTGNLLVPSFKYQGHFSDAIQIKVTEATGVPGQLQDLFIETELNKSQAYVQEQLLLTYRLYTTRSIESMDAEPLVIDNVRVEELPEARYQRKIQGTNYGILEVRYALFPQTSEPFSIPAVPWTVRAIIEPRSQSFSFGNGRYELKHLRTEEKTVDVQEKPDSYPVAQTWLPAQTMELSQEWSEPPQNFRVGEPLTRTITLQARGLTAEQLPPFAINTNSQDVRVYPDQPQLDNQVTADGIVGSRTETMAVVPNKAGEIRLPAIEVTWWDTNSDRLRTARLPAQTFHVSGGATGPGDGASPSQPSQAPEAPRDTSETQGPSQRGDSAIFWQTLTAVFAGLALLFGLLWWQLRRNRDLSNRKASASTPVTPEQTNEKRAFKDLRNAARERNLRDLRRALLRWAACRWPQQQPQSLHELALLLDDATLTERLLALDAELYGDGASQSPAVDTEALAQRLDAWRRQKINGSTPEGQLKPLY